LDETQALAALLRRCQAGDAAAWEEIVRTHHRRIYNLCYRFTGSPDDAQDLTQEVFIRLYRTLGSYETERGSFVTWVSTVTRNLLVDHFRKTKQERATDSLEAAPGGDEDALTRGPAPRTACAPPKPSTWSNWPCKDSPRNCGKRLSCVTCRTWTTRT